MALQISTLRDGLSRSVLRVMGSVPIVRGHHMKRYLGDACAMVSMLADAGIPLHTALRIAGEASPSVRVCRLLFGIAERLEAGVINGCPGKRKGFRPMRIHS